MDLSGIEMNRRDFLFTGALVVQMANLSLKHGRQIRRNPASQKVEI
jgi:hypothetical protein